MQQHTLDVLKNFAGFNKSILIREGNTIRTMNPEKTVFAVAEVDDNFTHEFGVFDLSQLLSTWSLFENPDITYEDKYIHLEEQGTKVKFYYTNPRYIQAAPNKEPNLPETLIQFELKKDVLGKILKYSSVLKLENLYINKDSVTCKNPDATGNEFQAPISDFHVTTDEDVEINIDIATLKLIHDDYDVFVTSKAIKFKAKTMKVEYVVVLNQ